MASKQQLANLVQHIEENNTLANNKNLERDETYQDRIQKWNEIAIQLKMGKNGKHTGGIRGTEWKSMPLMWKLTQHEREEDEKRLKNCLSWRNELWGSLDGMQWMEQVVSDLFHWQTTNMAPSPSGTVMQNLISVFLSKFHKHFIYWYCYIRYITGYTCYAENIVYWQQSHESAHERFILLARGEDNGAAVPTEFDVQISDYQEIIIPKFVDFVPGKHNNYKITINIMCNGTYWHVKKCFLVIL